MMEGKEMLAATPTGDVADEGRLPTARRGLLAGLGAGVVAIGCCVGPTVAALFGVMSAAAAADLANNLYAQWGWAFKMAGIISGGAAFFLARRQARTCSAGPRSLGRFALVLAATGVATYFALYATTTWLGNVAT
jgi:hypothetical protein